MDAAAPAWTPPLFDTSKSPQCLSYANAPLSAVTTANFYRSAKWAPDGSCVLATSEDRAFHVLNLTMSENSQPALHATPPLHQAAPILSSIWYPTASSLDPASFCFVASVRDCPVKLLDASSGRLRASYKIVDHRERFIAPHSMAFDPSMTKLFCGCEDFVEIFDVQSPGEGARLPTSPSKKSRDGIKGLISSLVFNYSFPTTFALGSFSSPSPLALFDTDVASGPTLQFSGIAPGGISHLQFHPTRPYLLFARSRRSGLVQCWDIRNPLGVVQELNVGKGASAQRMTFECDLGGKWLAAGNEEGKVAMFDIGGAMDNASVLDPTLSYSAHDDTIGSASFHPLRSYLLSVSGARHFAPPTGDDLSSSSSSSDSDSSVEEMVMPTIPQQSRSAPRVKDASMKTWDFIEQ